MDINSDAPVTSRHSTSINADPAAIWSVLTDIPAWPSWNTDVKSAALGNGLAAGENFEFKTGPGTVEARFEEVAEPTRLVIAGKMMGASSIYAFEITETDGGSDVSLAQSMEGMAVRPAKKMLQKIADKSLEDWLAALKTRVER